MLNVEVALLFNGLWDFTPRKVVFIVNSGMNGVRFHFMFMFVVWMGGVQWYCLVAKQFSLAGGSLRVEINGQCWISCQDPLLTNNSVDITPGYRISAGRGWRPTCQAARQTQHRSRRTLSPSRSPTLGPSPSHVARGREEVVVSSGLPVRDRGRRSDEATRGQRSERTTIGRECGGATRG